MTEITELITDVREQVLYLQELGIEALDARLTAPSQNATTPKVIGSSQIHGEDLTRRVLSVYTERPTVRPASSGHKREPERKPGSRLGSLPSLSNRKTVPFFDKYNPDERRNEGDGRQDSSKEPAVAAVVPALPEPTETIAAIRAEIGADCSRCKLSQLGRRQVVNSVGNFDADLMFVGEAPGADEDIHGEPFVGKAGQLLTDIIEKGLQISRKDVFIGNINRCRPPGNRTPEPDESAACKPFLKREIAVVRPKVIVVLGATAAQNLLETKVPISKLRGHFHDYMGVKVMPTFHPAYLLRDPHKKREVWEDMKMVRDLLRVSG